MALIWLNDRVFAKGVGRGGRTESIVQEARCYIRPQCESYEFDWNVIKTQPNSFERYQF